MMRRILLAAALCFLLAAPAAAGYIDTSPLDNALTGEESSVIGGADVENADVNAGFTKLWKSALALARKKLKSACTVGFAVLACCAVISIANNFAKASGNATAVKIINLTGSVAIISVALLSNSGVLTKCAGGIKRIGTFSGIVTPVYAVAAAVAKHPASAVAAASASLLFTNLIVWISLNLFIPLAFVCAAAGAVSAITENSLPDRLCEFIKWIVGFSARILLMIFFCYISMSGIVSSTADVLALKTAKAVISGAVPVVGGIISEASDAILSGAAVIKAGIGVFGFLGVCAICLAPFMEALINMLVYKLLSAVAGSLCGGAVGKALGGISTAYGLGLGALGACCAVQFISIVVTAAVTRV